MTSAANSPHRLRHITSPFNPFSHSLAKDNLTSRSMATSATNQAKLARCRDILEDARKVRPTPRLPVHILLTIPPANPRDQGLNPHQQIRAPSQIFYSRAPTQTNRPLQHAEKGQRQTWTVRGQRTETQSAVAERGGDGGWYEG